MMRALARPFARAPAVAVFLLCSIVVHLAVLRGASVSAWHVPPEHERSPVTVALIVPAAAAARLAAASDVTAVRPPPAARARSRPARRVAQAAAASVPESAAATAAPEALTRAASFADSDPFGATLGLVGGDGLTGSGPETAAQADAHGEAQGETQGETQGEVQADAQEVSGLAKALPHGATLPALQDAAADAAPLEIVPGGTPPAAPAQAPIVVTPQSGTARYRVHYGDPREGNVVAILEQRFEIGPEHYRLHSEGQAKGLVSWFYRGLLVQDSIGTVSAAGLAPSRYRERRGDRPARTATVDAALGEVVFASGQRREAPAGVQDRLSTAVQLALMRQARPAQFEAGATIHLPMLGNSSVVPVSWQVRGEETVDTDAGPVRALRLSRPGADRDDPAIDLWLALDARIVPVRMRITEPTGRALDQVLASQ